VGESRGMGWEGRKRREGWEGGGRGREGRGKGRGCGGARKVVCPGARAGSRRACWTRLIGSGDVGGLRPPFSGDVARNDSVVVFLSVGATATKTDTLEGCVG